MLSSFIHSVESINYSTIDSVLGEHQYKLIVKDPYDAIDDTTLIVNVLPEPNSAPVVQFDPYQVVYFSCVPNEETDCSQVVSLNRYNASYDPDQDQFTSTWYDDEWNVTSSLQTLNLGTSTFNLIATDTYNASDTLDFSIVISEPNSVPTAITLGTQEVFESTAELDSLDGLDSLLAIVQMPPGIPVATVAINGALNAGILASQMIATNDPDLFKKTVTYKENLKFKC